MFSHLHLHKIMIWDYYSPGGSPIDPSSLADSCGPPTSRPIASRSFPSEQFEYEVRRELSRLQNRARSVNEARGLPTELPHSVIASYRTSAQDNIRLDWAKEGIWREEWSTPLPLDAPLAHRQSNSRLILQPTGPWSHESSYKRLKPTRPLLYGEPSEKEEVVQDSTTVVAPEASRPVNRFRYLVTKEVKWLKSCPKYQTTSHDEIESIAYLAIKSFWKQCGVWVEEWGPIPGQKWAHEVPEESLQAYIENHDIEPGSVSFDKPTTADLCEPNIVAEASHSGLVPPAPDRRSGREWDNRPVRVDLYKRKGEGSLLGFNPFVPVRFGYQDHFATNSLFGQKKRPNVGRADIIRGYKSVGEAQGMGGPPGKRFKIGRGFGRQENKETEPLAEIGEITLEGLLFGTTSAPSTPVFSCEETTKATKRKYGESPVARGILKGGLKDTNEAENESPTMKKSVSFIAG
ncbi:hypothetical protein EDB80DRAFT_874440 [Ilyonectria destructans]|nr:hypothetical protein EDB80DRAFT_874440 [Ilyonectria destructans]